MNTCCPNCASNTAIGNELVSVCTECASVSAAGFSFSMPLLLAGAVVVLGMVAAQRISRRTRQQSGMLALS
jgi:hypothetical protein